MNANAALTNALYFAACVGIAFTLTIIMSFILPLLDRGHRWFE